MSSTTQFSAMVHSHGQQSRTVDRCRICDSPRLKLYLHLGTTPLANSYLMEQNLHVAEFREELALMLCQDCGLSQLSKVVHPDRMFRHYLYVSSTTETFREHCRELAATAIRASHAKPGDWVLDIASNDGCLLSQFKDSGMNVVGVDPAENLASEANAAAIPTLCAYWSQATAREVLSRFPRPTIMTATNVLAHVDDVHEFVEAACHCLAPRGVFVIECPYLLDFIEKNEFDTAYHEHLSYLSLHPMTHLMEKHGLQIWDAEHFENLHGGTIRVWVSRAGVNSVSPRVRTFLVREDQCGIKDLSRYQAFGDRVAANKEKLVRLLDQLRGQGKTIWAYGASAKGNTLMNYFGISHDVVPVAIDDNAKKWGLYTPGAHMRIAGISELSTTAVDYLLLLAWNFKDEIMRRCQRVGYTARFILPIPDVTVI